MLLICKLFQNFTNNHFSKYLTFYSNLFRFGENQGDICKFFTRKTDGTIVNHTNNVNIESFIREQEMNFALNIHIVNSYEKHLKYKTQPCNNRRAVNNLYQKLLADV